MRWTNDEDKASFAFVLSIGILPSIPEILEETGDASCPLFDLQTTSDWPDQQGTYRYRIAPKNRVRYGMVKVSRQEHEL